MIREIKKYVATDELEFEDEQVAINYQKRLDEENDSKQIFENLCPVIQRRMIRAWSTMEDMDEKDVMEENAEDIYEWAAVGAEKEVKRYFSGDSYFDNVEEIKEWALDDRSLFDEGSIQYLLETIYDLDSDDWENTLEWKVEVSVKIELMK